MLKGIHYFFAAAFTMSMFSCVHPMGQSDIEQLTTCKNTDLKAIRKNLLLAGYKVTNQSDDDIQTDFKQVSGYSSSKQLIALTVVKIDDKNFKFRVRRRAESTSSVPTNETSISNGSGQNNQKVSITQTQLVHNSDEFDQSYYIENRGEYEQTHLEVCGR